MEQEQLNPTKKAVCAFEKGKQTVKMEEEGKRKRRNKGQKKKKKGLY